MMSSSLAGQYETAQFILLQQKAQLASRIQLELISGGNIRFEEGTINDVWYSITDVSLVSLLVNRRYFQVQCRQGSSSFTLLLIDLQSM